MGKLVVDRHSDTYDSFIVDVNSTQKKVMLSLIKYMDTGNCIKVDDEILDCIVDDTKLAKKTIRNSLYELKALEFIEKLDGNDYCVNRQLGYVYEGGDE